jgi:hypothetical protein
MHFGEVQLGSNTNRLLNICNDSDLPTSFQFFTDDKNVFSFSKIEGGKPDCFGSLSAEYSSILLKAPTTRAEGGKPDCSWPSR